MREKFSEKYGFSAPRKIFQVKDMDDALKNRIWNTIKYYFIDPIGTNYGTINNIEYKDFIYKLYDAFFKTHEEPKWQKVNLIQNLKHKYFELEWFEIYDLIEFIPTVFYNQEMNGEFRNQINNVFKEEMSAYRFIDKYIVPIVEEIEIQEVTEALNGIYKPVRVHLLKSIELLSDKENPDYINSIKESISAVEALCQILTGQERYDLGKCLKELKLKVNKQFKNGMSTLYGWTSSEDGIRHAYTGEEIDSDFAEAKYMLVSCSAFINYIIEKNTMK